MFYVLERDNHAWLAKTVVRPSRVNLVAPSSSVHFLKIPSSDITEAPSFMLKDHEFLDFRSSLKVEEQLACFSYLNQEVIVDYPVALWYTTEVYEHRIRGTGTLNVKNKDIRVVSLSKDAVPPQRPEAIFSAIETQNAILFSREIVRFESTPLFHYYMFANAWKNNDIESMYSNLLLYLPQARSDSVVRFVFALVMLSELLISTHKSQEAIRYLQNEYQFVKGYPPFQTYILRFPVDVQRFIQGGI